MASLQETLDAFVQFVQAELFRRPFLNSDPNQETVMVRRGGGPRQLSGVAMTDDQVLARVGGQVKGVSFSDLADMANGNEKKMVFIQTPAALEWDVAHTFDSVLVEVYVVDENNERIHPDTIKAIDASNVKITFTKEQAGTAFLRWYN